MRDPHIPMPAADDRVGWAIWWAGASLTLVAALCLAGEIVYFAALIVLRLLGVTAP